MATLPPWLDINPVQSVLGAAQIGASMGEKQRGMRDQEAQFGQEMGLKQAELAESVKSDHIRLAASLQQQQQEQQFRVSQAAEQHQRSAEQLQLETQKAAASQQEAQMRLKMEAESAAQKFQYTQQYQTLFPRIRQQLVEGGASDEDATMSANFQTLAQLGPSPFGGSATPVAADFRAMMSQDQLAEKTKQDQTKSAWAVIAKYEDEKSNFAKFNPGKAYVPDSTLATQLAQAKKVLTPPASDSGGGGAAAAPSGDSPGDKDPLGLFTK